MTCLRLNSIVSDKEMPIELLVQAMLGLVWVFLAEKATELTAFDELYIPGRIGLVFFVGMVQLFTYASLVPILNGESTDAKAFGPFTAQAERWNRRLAMIGFLSLVVPPCPGLPLN